MLLWRIKPAAANADVVTDRNRQGVNHVAVIRVVVLEDFGQQIKERSPQARVYSGQPSVEAAFGDRFWYVAVLIQERAARLDVAAKEDSREQGYAHHFGGRQTDLWVVVLAGGFQEVVAQAVYGGYGIVHCCPLGPEREGFGGLRAGRILFTGIGGNLG